MDSIFRLPEAIQRDPSVEVWLSNQAGQLGIIARQWFTHMRACGDDVRELMHDGCPTACLGDAAFGYVAAYRDHVNVGFFFGAELHDPAGLLEGTGKRGRHVKVRPGANSNVAALDALIHAAYVDMASRLTPQTR